MVLIENEATLNNLCANLHLLILLLLIKILT